MRKLVLFGDIPQDASATLSAEFSAEIVVSARDVGCGFGVMLRDWDYDAVLVDVHAPKADLVTQAASIRRKAVVRVDPACGGPAVVSAVTKAMGWQAGLGTVFVIFTAAKGGVGKSTTAGCVAEWLSRQGKRVLGVDDNPSQSNLMHFFIDRFEKMPLDALRTPQALSEYIVPVHEGLDLLPPDDYASTGGLTLGVARGLWRAVQRFGYDYVIVDTTPTFATPADSQDFVDAPLTYPLICDAVFPSLFVVPFSPDAWGHGGLEGSRTLLARWGRLEWLLAAVVATDASHVLEDVPQWALDLRDSDRFFQIPHNRTLRASPRVTTLEPGFLRNPLRPYIPLARRITTLADDLRRRS